MNILDIYADLKDDIEYIEEELSYTTDRSNTLIKDTSSHLLHAGGKRIRPVFVLLGGKSGHYDMDRLKYVATTIELVHMATLVHDDVIDDAEMRRGQLTVKTKWDNRVAMYTGDYIIAQAIGYVSNLQNQRVHHVLSKAIVEMCIGEIEQIKALYEWDQSLRTYLLRIKRKTALLMAISCQLGGLTCAADEQTVQALYRYGYNVGMAFQITDDILDFTGTEKELGKPAGSDLLQGNITLPVLAAFRDEQVKKEIIAEFENATPNVAHIIELVHQSGGIACAKETAHKYLTKAKQALDPIPAGYGKQMFHYIAEFVEKRTF